MHRPLLVPRGPPSLLTAGHNGGDTGHGFTPEAQAGIRERGDAKNRLLGGSVYPEPSRGNPTPASPRIPTLPAGSPAPTGGTWDPATVLPHHPHCPHALLFYPAVLESPSLARNSARGVVTAAARIFEYCNHGEAWEGDGGLSGATGHPPGGRGGHRAGCPISIRDASCASKKLGFPPGKVAQTVFSSRGW